MGNEENRDEDGPKQEQKVRRNVVAKHIHRLRQRGDKSSKKKGLWKGIYESDALELDAGRANSGEVVVSWPGTGFRQ